MRYFFLLFMICLLGCQHPNKQIIYKTGKNLSVKKISKKDSIQLETRIEEKRDSVYQTKLLDVGMKYALENQGTYPYKKTLHIDADSSIYATVTCGHLFSRNKKHLLIKTRTNWNITMRVFLLERKKFKEVLKRTEWDLNFVADTIRDVNGDGFRDFISVTYSSSGCCARSYNNVNLYQAANGTFSKSYFFINPSYFSSEKVIRGVKYGHPGEVPLYKYKWNRANIDTVEYIYPADTLKKKFYLVHHYGDEDNAKKRKTLTAVPKEYLKIDRYDWFINY